MSLLWKTAAGDYWAEPWAGQNSEPDGPEHFHEMTPEEFGRHPDTLWHGSPHGRLGGGAHGIHVGTHQAAKEALNARIGTPEHGDWDGTRVYGETNLVPGTRTGYGMSNWHRDDSTPKKPSGSARYGHDEEPVGLHERPSIQPVHVIGPMYNEPTDPVDDEHANNEVHSGSTHGMYYENVGEDSGSTSAVVPDRDHLATHEDFVRHAHQRGHDVPRHNIERYGLHPTLTFAGSLG